MYSKCMTTNYTFRDSQDSGHDDTAGICRRLSLYLKGLPHAVSHTLGPFYAILCRKLSYHLTFTIIVCLQLTAGSTEINEQLYLCRVLQ